MKTRAGLVMVEGPWAGAVGSPWGPNGPTDPDAPEAYFASVPTTRDTPQPYRTSAGGATVTYLAMRVLSKNASVKTHQPQYWNNTVAVNNATDSLTAVGAQHWVGSSPVRMELVICSASPVLTYHSHGAPSGSVTQVSVLRA